MVATTKTGMLGKGFRPWLLAAMGVALAVVLLSVSHRQVPARHHPAAKRPILRRETRPPVAVLRLLMWGGYGPKAHIRAFERRIAAKYGREVKLEVRLVQSPEDFFGPVRDRSVDIVTLSQHMFKDERFQYIRKKLLLPIDLAHIPNSARLIPELRRAEYHVENGAVYGVPIANGPYGLAYSTRCLESPPRSWAVFWDSRFRQKYVIAANEYIYNVNITALAMGYSRKDICNFDVLNNARFKHRLRGLVVNAHSFWRGVDKPGDLKGQSLATSWGDALPALRRQGEDWRMASPREGTVWWVDDQALTWALADRPFMKKVAEEWIDSTLSFSYQIEHLVRKVGAYPATMGFAGRLTPAEARRLADNARDFSHHRRILQQTISQRDRNGLKMLWDEAMRARRTGGRQP